MPITFSFLLFAFLAILKFAASQELTNVKTALFLTNDWVTNINYLEANSSDFGLTFIMKSECETVVKFQEVYCLGKSINVIITDLLKPGKVYNLLIESKQNFSCSSNVQSPDEAALNPLYSKGEITLPVGVYSIAMKLDQYEQVLGFRGYAVKAFAPLSRLLIANTCRDRHNPNTAA